MPSFYESLISYRPNGFFCITVYWGGAAYSSGALEPDYYSYVGIGSASYYGVYQNISLLH